MVSVYIRVWRKFSNCDVTIPAPHIVSGGVFETKFLHYSILYLYVMSNRNFFFRLDFFLINVAHTVAAQIERRRSIKILDF